MSETTLDTVDYIDNLRQAMLDKKQAEKNIEKSMRKLQDQAMKKVREAYAKIFGQEIPFLEVAIESAIPSTGDNLRLDFDGNWDEKVQGQNIDSDTWISFLWMVVYPGPRRLLQVRVPLSLLSQTGITKVV